MCRNENVPARVMRNRDVSSMWMRSDREQKLLGDGDDEADGKPCCSALDAFIADN
jgi:hypothetical protein